MIPTGQDSLNTRSNLTVGERGYFYYSLPKAAEQLGDISRLPFSMKVLLENLLRFEDGVTVTRQDLHAERQAGDVADLLRRLRQRVVGILLAGDFQRAAGIERVLADLGHWRAGPPDQC